ncbi:MAG: hypothetical protein EZS28_002690 [Streblomastix strix]|uniref:Uncharacterized protein n=1 Tax=Streblomastix strix TaxID=222440 RepID=A0A5J4X4S0_9EUKA|nr:MAG: hypothetical protein EZS28_002690 [Streblomastix strix]
MSDVSQPKFFTKVTQIPGLPDIQKIMEEQKQQSAQKIHQKQSVSKFQQFFGSVTEQKQPSSQQQSQKQLQKPQQSPITSSQPPDPEIQFDPSITHISDNDSKSDSSLSVPNSPRHSPEMSQSLPSLPPMSPTSESRSSLKPLSPSLNSLPPISPIYSAQSQISPNLMQNFSTSPVDDLHSPRYFAEDMPNIIKNSYSSLKDAKHEQHDQYTQQDKAYIEEQLNEQEQGQEEEEELQRRDDEQLMDSERDREIIDSDKDREILYTDNERPQLEITLVETTETTAFFRFRGITTSGLIATIPIYRI